jgi:hypothetical protein
MSRFSAWLLLCALLGAAALPAPARRNAGNLTVSRFTRKPRDKLEYMGTEKRAHVKVTKMRKGFHLPMTDKLDKVVEILTTYQASIESGSGEVASDADSIDVPALLKLVGPMYGKSYTKLAATKLETAAGVIVGAEAMAAHGIEFTASDNGEGKNAGHMEENTGDGTVEAHEGDMFAGSASHLQSLKSGNPNGRRFIHLNSKEALATTHSTPWTGGEMFYCYSVDAEATGRVVQAVEVAAKQFTKAVPCTTMTRVGRSPTDATKCAMPNAVMVTVKPQGCWSYVGMIGGTQELNLESPGCDSMGVVVHEFLHAWGQAHEQSRSDRDDYVTILWDNIQPGKEHNFNSQSGTDISQPYDIMSLMHYGTDFFGIGGSKTIEPKDAAYQHYTSDPSEFSKYEPGNRIGMSQFDAVQLADQYLCKDLVSVLEVANGCTDIDKSLGTPWTNEAGQTCRDVWDAIGPDCADDYNDGNGANVYCCGCGGGLAVHSWVASDAPRSPPPPPSPKLPPPAPPRDCLTQCSNNYECGVCLVALPKGSPECPEVEPQKCSPGMSLAVGEMCETDGACGARTYSVPHDTMEGYWTGNCPGAHCPVGNDVYKAVDCYMPPSPPPAAPQSCGDCDNGYACGSCLVKVDPTECPKSSGDAWSGSPDCGTASMLDFGEKCTVKDGSGSNYCGVSYGADNCPYGDWNADVYKKVDCHQPSPPPPSPPSSPPKPSPPPSGCADLVNKGEYAQWCHPDDCVATTAWSDFWYKYAIENCDYSCSDCPQDCSSNCPYYASTYGCDDMWNINGAGAPISNCCARTCMPVTRKAEHRKGSTGAALQAS